MKKRIACDMDQVLGDIMSPWLEQYNKDYDYYLSPEDITVWNWHELTHPDCQKKIYDYLDNPDLFRRLPVMEGSQEVLELLNYKYEIYIVSAVYNPINIPPKVEWLREHYPFLDEEKFVFTRDKSIIAADYLIDDKPSNLKTFRGGKVLFDAPHNRSVDDYYRAINWYDLKKFFLKEHLQFNTFDKVRIIDTGYTRETVPKEIGEPAWILKQTEGEFDYMVHLNNKKIALLTEFDIEKF